MGSWELSSTEPAETRGLAKEASGERCGALPGCPLWLLLPLLSDGETSLEGQPGEAALGRQVCTFSAGGATGAAQG